MDGTGLETGIEYLPLRDVVFQTLRSRILTGELAPGERLMELRLADQLGVSRTPIREAIRKLELEGLVTMLPRRGAVVAQITEKGLRDVLEVRSALDALAVQLACQRISEQELSALLAAAGEFVRMTKTGDANRIARADVAFHDIIHQASHNEKLNFLVSNLSQQMYRYRLEYIKDASIHDRLVQEHAQICLAIQNRDEEGGVRAIRLHVQNQEKAIIRMLEERKKQGTDSHDGK